MKAPILMHEEDDHSIKQITSIDNNLIVAFDSFIQIFNIETSEEL